MISFRKDSSIKEKTAAERLGEKLTEMLPLRHYLSRDTQGTGFFCC